MAEVTLDGQPGQARRRGQLLQLRRLQRAPDRQRAVVVKDGMERLGQEPRPRERPPRSDEVVDDNAPVARRSKVRKAPTIWSSVR